VTQKLTGIKTVDEYNARHPKKAGLKGGTSVNSIKYANDPEYREKTKKRQLAKYYEQKALDPEKMRLRQKRNSLAYRMRKYGITEEQYEVLKVAQSNRCRICWQKETKVKREQVCELAIDHNHETGEVRGLLCDSCNRGLGFLKDDANLLREGANYLSNFS